MPYTLHAERTRVEVIPERGGLISRWQWQGHELLYLDRERFANPQLSVRGGIPILFPICGNLPEDTFHHNGQTYHLKQHGFARDLPWQVLDQQEHLLKLGLQDTPATRQVYPFAFHLTLTYTLAADALAIAFEVANPVTPPCPLALACIPTLPLLTSSNCSLTCQSMPWWIRKRNNPSPLAARLTGMRQNWIWPVVPSRVKWLASVICNNSTA